MASTDESTGSVHLPRVAITYCTQCRWMLRAAYFGQELLSTFGTTIGEIALIPATGGLFKVELTYRPEGQSSPGETTKEQNGLETTKSVLLWDRKAEGGFPETKVLKQRVRDHLDPSKDLGHSDRHSKKEQGKAENQAAEASSAAAASLTVSDQVKRNPDGTVCEDCA
ncbi:seleno protein domain-containing protein [Rhizodiscina lignyota]|uniref:Seleno protein domain-containing protein n=1 Tax=Rhizodiscina lignyota TaxID=1504668 RepID=A0A9P4I843_9PEZI|nr:seleno protein domain-containing protein [Rhizodiscina lignyota]